MKAPALAAVMERRILVNYRVDPDLLGSYLPAPFRPALVGGHGVAGICLIRLGRIRPAGLTAAGRKSACPGPAQAGGRAPCTGGPTGGLPAAALMGVTGARTQDRSEKMIFQGLCRRRAAEGTARCCGPGPGTRSR
jgi:hypothetical protein